MGEPACESCGPSELPLTVYTDALLHENGELEMIRSVRIYLCGDCNHEKTLERLGCVAEAVNDDDLMPHERHKLRGGE